MYHNQIKDTDEEAEMTTIFMDESGYTGPDLLSLDQPIFTLASLNYTEAGCQKLLEDFFGAISATDLKHPRKSRAKEQNATIDLLSELSKKPELIKIDIIHKEYMLVGKLVDFIIEPVISKEGFNIYSKGENNYITNGLYNRLPIIAGQTFYADLLKRFQKMMRSLDQASYDQFFLPLFEEDNQRAVAENFQEELDFYLSLIKKCHLEFGFDIIKELKQYIALKLILRDWILDVSFTSVLHMMSEWRREVSDSTTLIYDESTLMARSLPILNMLVDPTNRPATVGYGNTKIEFPIGIQQPSLGKSENQAGIKIAGLVAGAAAKWSKWHFNGKDSKDQYESTLDTTMSAFRCFIIGPLSDLKPVKFDTADLESPSDPHYIIDTLVAKKLQALRNLQNAGAQFFYKVDPKQ